MKYRASVAVVLSFLCLSPPAHAQFKGAMVWMLDGESSHVADTTADGKLREQDAAWLKKRMPDAVVGCVNKQTALLQSALEEKHQALGNTLIILNFNFAGVKKGIVHADPYFPRLEVNLGVAQLKTVKSPEQCTDRLLLSENEIKNGLTSEKPKAVTQPFIRDPKVSGTQGPKNLPIPGAGIQTPSQSDHKGQKAE